LPLDATFKMIYARYCNSIPISVTSTDRNSELEFTECFSFVFIKSGTIHVTQHVFHTYMSSFCVCNGQKLIKNYRFLPLSATAQGELWPPEQFSSSSFPPSFHFHFTEFIMYILQPSQLLHWCRFLFNPSIRGWLSGFWTI
jgi:hypothetical protein